MKSKRLLAMLLAVLLLIGNQEIAFAQGGMKQRYSIYIDGTATVVDVSPLIQQGRILVPISFIAKELGISTSWDAKAKEVKLSGEKVVVLKENAKIANIDGNQVELDVKPILINGRLMLPLRFISENYNAKVRFSSTEKKIYIDTVKKILKEEGDKKEKSFFDLEISSAYYEDYKELRKYISKLNIEELIQNKEKQKEFYDELNRFGKKFEVLSSNKPSQEQIKDYYVYDSLLLANQVYQSALNKYEVYISENREEDFLDFIQLYRGFDRIVVEFYEQEYIEQHDWRE